MHAARRLPPGETQLAPRLRGLVERVGPDLWRSVQRPIGKADVLSRLATDLFALHHRRTPADSVRASPAATDLPKPVPIGNLRIKRSLTIDTSVPPWHSTGLYAEPGEPVTGTVSAATAMNGGFHGRVRAHAGSIWNRPGWLRMPAISGRFPIPTATTRVANAFGGLIHVKVPGDANPGSFTVEIEGAVAAQHIVLGRQIRTHGLPRSATRPCRGARSTGGT